MFIPHSHKLSRLRLPSDSSTLSPLLYDLPHDCSFLYLFCLFLHLQPLSSAFYRSACFRRPLHAFHRASPSPSFELSVLSFSSDINVVFSCKFAMPLAHTINPLQIDVIPLLSRIPFMTMQSCRSHSDFQFVYNTCFPPTLSVIHVSLPTP